MPRGGIGLVDCVADAKVKSGIHTVKENVLAVTVGHEGDDIHLR